VRRSLSDLLNVGLIYNSLDALQTINPGFWGV